MPSTDTISRSAMAATSHPLAVASAVRCLEAGGNAADAAVCAAAVLCVVEPMSTGIGGDAFALVWRDGDLTGLNASGRAPAAADPDALGPAMPFTGPQTVTVPGAVAGWQALLERHGTWGLDRCLVDAIDAAASGFELTPVIAGAWERIAPDLAAYEEAASVFLPPPAVGTTWRNPQLAATLKRIAADGPDGFYRGPVAAAIASASWLEESDLAGMQADWVEPLRLSFGDATVCELPPNGQGAAALQAMGIARDLDLGGLDDADRVHLQAEAMKLAFADAYRYIADEPLPAGYLDEAYLATRRGQIDRTRAAHPGPGALPRGGTVYLTVVDGDRMACSFIQSLYIGFGSRVVAPGTGVMLQNRGACFTLEAGHPNRLAPGKRPFHTIIPGMLLDGAGDSLIGPFGLMGGHMQPQGHLQLLTNLRYRGLGPQAALDAPRWRLDQDDEGWLLCLEPGLWDVADELERRGHRVWRDPEPTSYGGGQAIMLRGDELVGGSEPRKDGLAAGY
ncbi:MAG: gamma-glutamyltranspeptidase / glutathione hydrolase [Gaiellaceae bacterium]|nr:gamma-glutamyltranspeptidase / glutathione hydrolase [Gaiellaceae bacterium]